MLKNEFLTELRDRLFLLPEGEIEERLSFYNEMINDRMEEGLTEDEAVSQIGSVDEIAAQILSSASVPAGEPVPPSYGSFPPEYSPAPKKRSAAKTWLLILFSPVILALLIAAFAVWISLAAASLAVVVAFWAAAVGLAAGVAGSIFYAIVSFFLGKPLIAFAWIGAGCVLAGVSILLFLCGGAVSKGMWAFIKFITRGFCRLFRGRER